ncbi:citrate synthase family protein [Sinorhizobium arboris]|uniref:citrate synthase family protein n=1 Tax=Sinorhizobium arboris TaxID=76745 RepID=UPI0003F630C5|nr:citrate synthase family protein [Sinorhizobium arboris]
MGETAGYMTAKEAAAELNVSVATLYAYVSRGIVQSEARPGSRSRRYLATDIRALAEKNKIAKHADGGSILSFGSPLLDSEITYTDGKRLYFRGRDSSLLATASASLESVATLIWDCSEDHVFQEAPPRIPAEFAAMRHAGKADRPLVLCQALLPLIGEMDLRAYDRSRRGASQTGARVLRLMASLVTDMQPSATAVHETLSFAWQVGSHAHLVRSALILAADHELNASTFTVRVAASAGAPLYHAAAAGLATLQGARHGGEIERALRLLREMMREHDPAEAVSAWMRRGDAVPGFGHPLYPEGDPRARTLLTLMEREFTSSESLALHRAAAVAQSITGRHLNFDGALAILSLHLGLPAHTGLSLLAIGRVVGWIGHAIEQYLDDRLIRPRARYVGLR